MKKLVVIFMALFMVVSCSSDDNKGDSNGQGNESGISTSTKIKTPQWLQGEWVVKGS